MSDQPPTSSPNPSESYHVRLDKEDMVFSAGHFITYAGSRCERLHGHNYRVVVEVHGRLDENQYVVDFLVLKKLLRSILNELDHRVLLAVEHPGLTISSTETEVTAKFQDRRWVFPREDCVLLPVPNTTAEQFARLIGRRLLARLADETETPPDRVSVAVDENHGQWGVCEFDC